MPKRTIVIGLGNTLMADEGIGPAVIEHLVQRQDEFPHVTFFDMGCGGIAILHKLTGYDKAVFIDCAMMDCEPGTIKRFTPDEVDSIKQLQHYSLHEADLLGILRMAKLLGHCPEEVVIFGIQPERIEQDFRQLSDPLQQNIPHYADTVCKALD